MVVNIDHIILSISYGLRGEIINRSREETEKVRGVLINVIGHEVELDYGTFNSSLTRKQHSYQTSNELAQRV